MLIQYWHASFVCFFVLINLCFHAVCGRLERNSWYQVVLRWLMLLGSWWYQVELTPVCICSRHLWMLASRTTSTVGLRYTRTRIYTHTALLSLGSSGMTQTESPEKAVILKHLSYPLFACRQAHFQLCFSNFTRHHAFSPSAYWRSKIKVRYPAKGLACIVASFIRVSVSGWNVFSFTGSFSSSSSVSKPSIILQVREGDML